MQGKFVGGVGNGKFATCAHLAFARLFRSVIYAVSDSEHFSGFKTGAVGYLFLYLTKEIHYKRRLSLHRLDRLKPHSQSSLSVVISISTIANCIYLPSSYCSSNVANSLSYIFSAVKTESHSGNKIGTDTTNHLSVGHHDFLLNDAIALRALMSRSIGRWVEPSGSYGISSLGSRVENLRPFCRLLGLPLCILAKQ